MTRGKTIDLTRRTFAGKVMSLLLNMLSRLVITFLPRNTELRCFQTFPKYSSQWRFYSVFWFLSISEPRNITPTGKPNFMKNTAARSPKAAAATCPTLGTGVWEALRRWQVTLYSRDTTFVPLPTTRVTKLKAFRVTKLKAFRIQNWGGAKCIAETPADNRSLPHPIKGLWGEKKMMQRAGGL